MVKVALLLILDLFLIDVAYSQGLIFKHLTSEEGLPSNFISAIFQDSEDFMWFGTNYGVSRFDGYDFINFQHVLGDSLTLSDNFVSCMVEDSDRNIWIGTGVGLNKFNKNNFVIEPISGFEGLYISCLLQIENDILLVGTHFHGLIQFNLKNGKQKHLIHSSESSSISSNMVNCLIFNRKHDILVGTQNGLDVFNPRKEIFEHIITEADVTHFSYCNDSSIFISASKPGLYYKWTNQYLDGIVLPSAYADENIVEMASTEFSSWLSLGSKGILYQDINKDEQYHLLYNKFNPEGISSNVIQCFYKDKWENIWIGTIDGGVNFIENKGKKFIHMRDDFQPSGIRNNKVRSIFQDSEGDIWVGTKENGTLSKFNRKTLTFDHYFKQESTVYNDNYILCITEYQPGKLLVGTLNGLYLFNKRNGSYEIISDIDESNYIHSKRIYAILKDSDVLYIGHQSMGLDIYNISKQTLENYRPNNDSASISGKKVRVIYKDSKQNIWVGTSNGLNRFDSDTGTFQHFLYSDADSTSISNNHISCIFEDADKNLWVGTNLGLNLMNQEKGTFKVYTTKEGLPDNTINAIYNDEEGNLWLSTHNGISKFNPVTKKVRNYYKSDGISANELSSYAHCKTVDGEIIFGSNKGFTLFDPKQIIDNDNVPNVVLTNFKLANKVVDINDYGSPLKKHISQCKDITLTYKQRFFSFEYVAINYSSTEKNQYAYMMEGLEDDWNYVGTKREVSYTNLSPGNYIFKVKASNNDGVWNQEGVAIAVLILPPPWLTWWAYSIYFILLVSILLWVGSVRTKRIMEQKEHELDQIKIKFFANVSHEFRTPLTLILAPLEKILTRNDYPEQEYQLKLMNRNARRLLNLVNQLLDFQKVGVGQLEIEKSLGDLVQFTKDLSYSFIELSDKKNIQFSFKSKVKECLAMFDYNMMEKIVFNLLSNAFKFTPENGEILIEISLANEDERKVVIKVKDNGIGISVGNLKKVFKRFYQIESSDKSTSQGSGIGLALTKELVELHGGQISVDSSIGIGTCFKVILPLVGVSHEIKNETTISDILDSIDNKELVQGNKMERGRRKLPIVLLVEDNADFRSFLKMSLLPNYKLLEAANGVEGLQLACKHIPDLIISDVMMPQMDGKELCAKIKNDKITSHIPFILLTAQVAEHHQVVGFESGADQYVTKPFNFEVLESRIKGLLDQRNKLQNVFSKKIEVNPSEITVTSIDEKFIRQALDLVEKNIQNPNLSVEELSRELGVSRVQSYRKIINITGKSPTEFIRSIRLKRAAQLLLSSKLTISEISYKVGYNDPKHFSKLFKMEFKVVPSKYTSSNSSEM